MAARGQQSASKESPAPSPDGLALGWLGAQRHAQKKHECTPVHGRLASMVAQRSDFLQPARARSSPTLCHRQIPRPAGVIPESAASPRIARARGGLMSGRGGQVEARAQPARGDAGPRARPPRPPSGLAFTDALSGAPVRFPSPALLGTRCTVVTDLGALQRLLAHLKSEGGSTKITKAGYESPRSRRGSRRSLRPLVTVSA
jgi:hypothetical protein